MARKTEKPDLDNIKAVNPYSVGLVVRVNKKVREVINKYGNPDRLEFEMEATRFTRVFEQAGINLLVKELPIRCKEMYLHVMYHVEIGKECIWLPREQYMNDMGIKSLTTFRETVRGLEERALICHVTGYTDTYWINPHYFFKGDRVSKYKNNVVVVNEKKPFIVK